MATQITTLGSFPGANSKDKSARIPAAISALNRALAGDASALLYMQQQKVGSATAVGKDAFTRALAIYDQQKQSAPPLASSPTIGVPVISAIPLNMPVLLPSPTVQPKPPIPSTITMDGPHAAPVGYAPTPPDMTHPPVVTGGVSVSGVAPGVITPVVVGSNGGVITGPAEYEGPDSVPAPANFGTAQNTIDGTGGAVTKAATDTKPAGSSSMMVLILIAGVVLFALVDSKRK